MLSAIACNGVTIQCQERELMKSTTKVYVLLEHHIDLQDAIVRGVYVDRLGAEKKRHRLQNRYEAGLIAYIGYLAILEFTLKGSEVVSPLSVVKDHTTQAKDGTYSKGLCAPSIKLTKSQRKASITIQGY